MSARRRFFSRALLALATVVASAVTPTRASAQAPAIPIQLGVTVVPETVTVGQPFVVTVRLRAPLGATVEFPAGPDSAGGVEALDSRRVTDAGDRSTVDQSAVYRLVAWQVDTVRLGMPDVVVRTAAGERRVSLAATRVFVASVLPADSALRVPKPARDIFVAGPPWWWPWLPILLAILAILGLLWWLWRRFRRRKGAAADEELPPIRYAEREFDRIEGLGLIEAGERGRFVALMVEVLRDFLARRVPGADASLTSTELLAGLRGGSTVVPLDRLAPLLAESDLIKFARRPVSAERAHALGAEARSIVRDVEAKRAAEEAAAAAALAAAEAAAKVRRRVAPPPPRENAA
ncbi:MAG TPA: DUF4381 family protein [Gemmatimonadaceae bacterium]|nr:DUF4381 family protein [Gemmatimonadaceae bacterium]